MIEWLAIMNECISINMTGQENYELSSGLVV